VVSGSFFVAPLWICEFCLLQLQAVEISDDICRVL
jgi:hypothetical protein